jgi:Uma2 family endonuclease
MVKPDTQPDRSPSPDRTMWTVADLEAIPDDGNRYEILHGELLVTPLPSTGHQRIAVRLTVLTVMWCRAHTGWTVLAPGGAHIGETTWLEPDLAVFAAPESANLSWREMPPPLLLVEILSPSTRRRDRHRKRPTYLSHGVGDVWLVDQDTRSIERWTAASEFPETFRDGITWTPDATLPPLVVSDAELFGARD